MKKLKEEESEFGKGLVICLVKFAEHIDSWGKWKTDYQVLRESQDTIKRMVDKLEDKEEHFSENQAVELFFSGASDHLYEIEVPQEWKNTLIAKKVKELQDFGLEIGHSFNHTRKYSERDVFYASDLCREIALLIDKKLGLEPELGRW